MRNGVLVETHLPLCCTGAAFGAFPFLFIAAVKQLIQVI